jgi:D-3-phosphoglycerate dehydrogenase / 2-oxoglutarate reductase
MSSTHPVRILIADQFSEKGITFLRAALPGVIIHNRPEITPTQLLSTIGDYTALIVRSRTRVTADVLAAAPKLMVVARAGVGLDNIDQAAAIRRDVQIINSPAGNVEAVAEHTIAMLLALARHIPAADTSMKSGKWEKNRFLGVGIHHKVLGIIGLGRVGSEVALLASGLGMQVLAYDPFPQIERVDRLEQLGRALLPMEQVLRRADFVTLHVALQEGARSEACAHLIGQRELRLFKPGARLINCARGGLIDECALLQALDDNRLAGAALDVFSQEPIGDSDVLSKLLADTRVIATPHLGGSTSEAQHQVALDVAEQLLLCSGRIASLHNLRCASLPYAN